MLETHNSGRAPLSNNETSRVQSCTIKYGADLPLPLQEEAIRSVSQLTQSYADAGDFVLPQSEEKVAFALRERRLIVALSPDGSTFVGGAKWVPLHTDKGILQIAEIGSLVRAPNTKGYGNPTPVVQCVATIIRDLNSRNVLAIATARSEKSRICLSQSGMFEARWDALSALTALTCDPGCAPGPLRAPAWISCGSSISCAARKEDETARTDACHLFVSHRERALAINEELLRNTEAHDQGCFSALRLRAAFGFKLG